MFLNLEVEAGAVELGHTNARRQELRETLDSILSEGQVLTKTAESLRGRLQWFETFAFGRTANSCLQRLAKISMCSGRGHRLTANDYAILTFRKNRVLTAPPIQIHPCQLETWFIFTDGSCESQEASGGVGGAQALSQSQSLTFFWNSLKTPSMNWSWPLFL